MYDVIIKGGTILTMDPANPRIENGTICIAGNRVERLVARDDPALTGRVVIQASGRVILPGLINAHTHLFQTLLRGALNDLPLVAWLRSVYAVGNYLTVEENALGAMIGCLESIRSGVTTIVEHAFLHPSPSHIDAVVSVFREIGVRGVLCRAAMDSGDLAPDNVKQDIDTIVKDWARLAESCQDKQEAMMGIMVGPNTPGINTSSDLIIASKKFADEHHLIWNPHIAESKDINERIRAAYGLDGVVEYLHSLGVLGPNLLAAHCVHLNPEEVRLLASSGGSVVYNPVSNMFLGDGIAPVADLLREGATVCMGTDGACSNISQDMFEVMKAGSLLQKIRYGAQSLPCEEVLKMVTLGAATALGLEDKIGSIKQGKLADLIILNLHSKAHTAAIHSLPATIVYGAKSTDVETVIINGKVIMECGEIKGVDEQRVIQNAQSAGLRLAERSF